MKPGIRLGPYEIVEQLGVGGMGEVWLAIDSRLGRRVAIKVLPEQLADDPERLHRLETEARTIASIDHPNIVTVYSFESAESDDGQQVHFITMQLVEGETLTDHAPPGGYSLDDFLSMAISLADALAAAHERGVVHRDLKPSNIMVSGDGRIRILDFGLAKLSDESAAALHDERSTLYRTQAGKVMGTVAYMAPEQAEGKPIDHRSDLFALGIILYEMITGRRPFEGDTQMSMISSIVKDTPPSVSDLKPAVPRHLARIIKALLEKNPDRRCQSAKDVRNQLEELRGELLSGDLERPAQALPPRPVGRYVGIVAAVVVAVLAVVGLWRRSPELPAESAGDAPPAVATLPGTPYLALLPLRASGGAEDVAFAAGLTEAVTARLALLTPTVGLSVLTSSDADRLDRPERAAIDAGVELVVTGELDRTGGDARVQLRLLDGATGAQLGERQIDVARGDPFELVDALMGSTAAMAGVELGPSTLRSLPAYGTGVAAAYQLYLQGLGSLSAAAPDLDRGNRAFEQALVLDPDFAAAIVGLGRVELARWETDRDDERLQRAAAACQSAADRDDRLAGAFRCLGTVAIRRSDYDAAVVHYSRAVYLEPTSDEAVGGLATAYSRLGRVMEAEQTHRAAVNLRPLYIPARFDLVVFLYIQGRIDEAVEQLERVVEMAPSYQGAVSSLGGLYTLQGRYEEAVGLLERANRLQPTGSAFTNLATTYFVLRRYAEAVAAFRESIRFEQTEHVLWGNLGDAYFWAPGERDNATGAYERAAELAREQLAQDPDDHETRGDLAKYLAYLGERDVAREQIEAALRGGGDANPQTLFHAVLVYQQLGEPDTALEMLGRAVDAGYSMPWFRATPELDDLRNSDRYRELQGAWSEADTTG